MIGKSIGRYNIIEKLGEGGMGAVFKAEDSKLHRIVALKALSLQLTSDEEARKRFIREAQAASSLNHPNITTVHDLLEDGDQDYICMEYVEGQTLKDLVQTAQLPSKTISQVLLQIASALALAHSNGILHRDVKSANIMLRNDGQAKLMDFGLAQLQERSQLTQQGTTLGTMAYSSPEQITGAGTDTRSEIFSLGIVTYELLTGQLPFPGASGAEILHGILNAQPTNPSEFRPELPAAWDQIIRRMLEKDPDERYQSCDDLITEVSTALGIELVTGVTPIPKRVSRSRRIQLQIILPIALLTVGILAAVVFGVLPRNRSSSFDRIPIAILPIENIGPEALEQDLANTLVDNIRTESLGLQYLSFRAPSVIRAITQEISDRSDIATDLNVAFLIEGRASLEEERVHLIIDLVDGETESSVWNSQYDFQRKNIQLHCRQVIRDLIQQLEILLDEDMILPGDPRLVDQRAIELYEEGLPLITNTNSLEDMLEGISIFEESRSIDSSYAPVWARLAHSYFMLFWQYYYPFEENYAKARNAITRAIELDDTLAKAYSVSGAIKMHYDRNWEGAEEGLRTAVDLSPENLDILGSYAGFLLAMLRFEELREIAERIQLIDRSHDNNWTAASYLFAGDIDRAISLYKASLHLTPDSPGMNTLLAYCLIQAGRLAEGVRFNVKADSLANSMMHRTQVGVNYALMEEVEKAEAILDKVEDPVNQAYILTALGRREEAIQALEDAYESDSPKLSWLYAYKEFVLADLRTYPRFQAILANLNFPSR